MMLLCFTVAPESSSFQLHLTNTQVLALTKLSKVLTGASYSSISDLIQKVFFGFLSAPNKHIMQDHFSCNLI